MDMDWDRTSSSSAAVRLSGKVLIELIDGLPGRVGDPAVQQEADLVLPADLLRGDPGGLDGVVDEARGRSRPG